MSRLLSFIGITVIAAGCNCSGTPPVSDGGTCVAGGVCSPTDVCKTGVVVCTNDVQSCPSAGNKANGTACGTGRVCASGVCSACVSNTPCTPSNTCHVGATDCSSGTSACTDTIVSVDAGTPCGTNQVCTSSGTCAACTANVTCAPSNPCHQGATSCATGASACVDTSVPTDAGTACGTNQVCSSAGACVACTANVGCLPGNICHLGATSCSTGASLCTDTSLLVDAGTPCGANLVCAPSGNCSACVANTSCPPLNVCHQGLSTCSTGTLSCTDTGTGLDAGTPCGANLVCAPSGNCTSCVANTSCVPPANACHQGLTTCSSGAPVCTPLGPVVDGSGCDAGVCFGGTCRGPLIISTVVNLSTDSLTAGRSCAEGAAWSVTSLASASASLITTPDAGCLSPGDRVILINLQGTPSDFANVGNYELLTVASVAGSNVTFSSSLTRAYGSADGGTTGLSSDGGQKVALQRVPELGDVQITDAGFVIANPFDGFTGGIVALRAQSLTVQGTISAMGIGYRNGDWNQDDSSCSDSIDTGAGESYSGPSTYGIARNGGGAGGISALNGVSFNGNDPLNASAGHSDAGEPGANGNGRTIGSPGLAYGAPAGVRLTMGSGAGGNLTCTGAFSGVPRVVPVPSTAGGIVYVAANQLTVGPTGVITASAGTLGRSSAAAGGYVLLRGRQVDLGTLQVTADGSVATSVLAFNNVSSPGYVAIHYVTGTTGTTSPPAATTVITTP